ncbi:hypothetical protein [Microcystis phage Mel-JY34]
MSTEPGDVWSALKERREAGAEARRTRRKEAETALRAANIQHRTSNSYAHVIITHCGCTYDFWPGPGTWKSRSIQAQGGASTGRGL